LSTSESRSILPEKIKLRDGVFNIGRSLLVADALRTADYRLHQPYRLARLAGVEDILLAAKQAGAAAAAIFGAGPEVSAFSESGHSAIQRAMEEAAKNKGMEARGFVLRISNRGADGEDQPQG
jgi:homoserine kinase